MRVSNILTVHRDELTSKQWRRLFRRLTFIDATDTEYRSFRWRKNSRTVEIPRGAWSMPEFEHVVYEDKRSCPPMPELDFALTLDDTTLSKNFEGQSDAVAAMLKQEQGLVVRMPGSGKSQIILNFVARCRTRSLVIVHTQDLIDQWVTYAKRAIPGIDIGVIQGPNYHVGHLTIASLQSLIDFVDFADMHWWRQFGATIVDETHHAPAATWEVILNNSTSRYRLGTTATLKRADKKDPVIQYLIGPVIHKGEFKPEIPTHVVPVKTGYYFPYRGSFDWRRLLDDLIVDPDRNQLAADIADREVNEGNSVLILSRSIKQLEDIEERMSTGRHAILARTGKHGIYGPKRERLVKQFRSGKLRCVLATQLADEGLDIRRLNRLLLVHPGKAEGRLTQQVGRSGRAHADKEDAIVYDFVDDRVSVLRRQWMQRKQGYKSMKIRVKKTKGGSDNGIETKERRFIRHLKPERSGRSREADRGARSRRR